jgi:hypothetical protein
MTVKPSDPDALIAALVDDLGPATPLRRWRGLALFAAAAALTVAIVVFALGLRPGIATGHVAPMFLLANGLYAMLGIAAAATTVSMARPQVGNRHDGWTWAAAMTALLPAAALLMQLIEPQPISPHGSGEPLCAVASVALGLIVMAGLTLWLRRGAPTSPARAGLLTGIAGGSIGAFAFGFHCAHDDLFHTAIWHGAAILVSAAIGRAVVPRLVRW